MTYTLAIIEVLTFLSVAILCVAALRGVSSTAGVRRRLAGTKTSSAPTVKAPEHQILRDTTVRNPILAWVQSTTSLKDVQDRNKLRRELALAGFTHPAAPALYVVARFGLAIGLPLAMVALQAVLPKPLSALSFTSATLIMCGMGLVGPRSFIDGRIRSRQEMFQNEFPDTLDLLVVCVEAGLGLEAAFVRVTDEVRDSHPRTAEEFGRLGQELAAGRSRSDALRAMADRAGVDTVKSFVALVIQTDALGVSIAQTLRTYSGEMREHRMLRAEEKAARIPVLMTIPLIFCILPVIVAVIMLPLVIDMIRTVLPALKS